MCRIGNRASIWSWTFALGRGCFARQVGFATAKLEDLWIHLGCCDYYQSSIMVITRIATTLIFATYLGTGAVCNAIRHLFIITVEYVHEWLKSVQLSTYIQNPGMIFKRMKFEDH